MSNPTVGRRVTPEAAGVPEATGSPLTAIEAFTRQAYAIPFATLIAFALLVLILVRLADIRLAVSGSVAAGRG